MIRLALGLSILCSQLGAQAVSTPLDEGRAHLNAGRFAEAVRAFQAATRHDSTSVLAWRGLASALHRLERYADALLAIDRAVAIAPNDAPVRFNRGLTLSELGRIDEAEAELELTVRIRPTFAAGWTELGAARSLLGRNAEARRDWDRAISVDSSYIWTRFYRGLASVVEGDYHAAAIDLDAVTAKESLLSAHLWRWAAHRLAGRPAPPLTSTGTDWPAPVARYLRGEMTDSQLVASARDVQALDDRRLTAALFYVGVKQLADGNIAAGRSALTRSTGLRAPRHAEVVAAGALLARIDRP